MPGRTEDDPMTMIQPLEPATATPRVLVVDDEPDMLELLGVALTSLREFDVVLASSADAAIAAIKSDPSGFDMFLLDIQMPQMGGVELLGEIRRMPHYADTPVIMLTAMSDREYVDAAFREGAHDYVTKPFDYDELLHRIDAASEPGARDRRDAGTLVEDLGRFGGVDRLIGPFEFNNYISQLSHGRLYDARLFAVRLRRPTEPDARHGEARPNDLLPALANAISLLTAPKGYLFCPYGTDTFLMLAHGEDGPPHLLQEHELNRIFLAALSNADLTEGYKALVGEPVSMRSLSRNDVASAVQDAVRGVEKRQRTTAEREKLTASLRAPLPLPRHKPANLYEKVLHELFDDRSYLRRSR
jgi:CheY-like chemotaxis protein